MSTTVHRTAKSRKQSLFFHDLASPVSTTHRGSGKFTTPGQAAAVSALWRENFSNSDLPPPPMFTLEDRSDFSPESGIPDYPMSSESNLGFRTPVQSSGGQFSTPRMKAEASTSYAVMGGGQQLQNQQSPVGSLSWWSPGKSASSGEQDEKGKGSPVEGVINSGALIMLPPPREVARLETQRNSLPVGDVHEEEWVTVYGFSPGDTNFVLREFEKCGVILKHVPGPRGANWIHILYQNRSDAQKALSKNGMQINGVLIVGVKLVDPGQHQVLNERLNNQGFMTSTLAPLGKSSEPNPLRASPHIDYLQNESNGARHSSGAVAAPEKSVAFKIMDLMFGV